MEKSYKQLKKYYKKQLKDLQNKSIFNGQASLNCFVTYLKFLRDYLILTEPLEIDGKENFKITSLSSAIIEYEKYNVCVQKYFKLTKGTVTTRLDPNKSEQEILEQYSTEKMQHWKYFWQLLAMNMELWGE